MVYFGTIDGPLAKMQDIKCMVSPIGVSSSKYSTEMKFENGGGDIESSTDSQKRFDISFIGSFNDDQQGKDIDIVKDYYDGQYGDGLIYFDDPTIPRGQNVLRRNWATPALIELGYKNIVNPDFFNTEFVDVTGGYGAPTRAIKLTALGTFSAPEDIKWLNIPIPAGHTLWVSTRNDFAGGASSIVPILQNRNIDRPSSFILSSPIGSNELFNPAHAGINSLAGPEIGRIALAPGLAGATLTIQSIDVIILPNGETPPATGDHQPGRGSSGFKFGAELPYEYQSAHTGVRTFSTELIEVGEWKK